MDHHHTFHNTHNNHNVHNILTSHDSSHHDAGNPAGNAEHLASDIPYESLVQHEHAELFHALTESLNRSSSLQRQMRQMKKHLVSIGIRYQVVAKQSRDDGKALIHLRNEALKAKTDELIATKQVDAAFEIIQSLNLEISSLKRTLKDIQSDKQRESAVDLGVDPFLGSTKLGNDFGALFAQTAPAEPIQFDLAGGGPQVESFEQWKIRKWISPPERKKETASLDNHLAQMLAEAATKESMSRLSADAALVEKIRAGKVHMNVYFEEKRKGSSDNSSKSTTVLPSVHSPPRTKTATTTLRSNSSSALPNTNKKVTTSGPPGIRTSSVVV